MLEGNVVVSVGDESLGFGRVVSVEQDEALIGFAGAGSQWIAVADLARHVFPDGAILRSNSVGGNGTVVRSRISDGVVSYWMRFGNEAAPRRLSERDIDLTPAPRDPLSLLLGRRPDDAVDFLLTIRARELLYAYSYDELVSLSNARIELYPHQVFVAHRVLQETPPRFLLSDEVGLGKTIEAGLIIKELRARGAADRVLIVAPSGLVPQWVSELNQKFNEAFIRIDSTTMPALRATRTAEQVWSESRSIVTSIHYLRAHAEYVELLTGESWDLIVFDEAHHLRRSRGHGSEGTTTTTAYRIAEQLALATDALLLLTATPLQLDPYELYALIELLDPTRFPDFQEFERSRREIPRLNGLIQRIGAFDELDAAGRLTLAGEIAALLHEVRHQASAPAASILTALEDPRAGRPRIVEQVSDQHPLSAVMVRNRKRVVFDDLKPRRATIVSMDYSPPERAAYTEVTRYLEDAYNLAMSSQNQALGFVMVTYRKMLTSSAQTLRVSLERRTARLEDIRRGKALLDLEDSGELLDRDDTEELDGLLERYDARIVDIDPAGIAVEIDELRRLTRLLGAIDEETKASRLAGVLRDVLAEPDEKVLVFTQFTETLTYLARLLGEEFRVATFHGGMSPREKDQQIDRFRARDGAQVLIATEAAGEGRNLQFCHVMVNYDLPWNPMKVEQRIGRLDRIGQRHPVEIFNFAVNDTVEDRIITRLLQRIGIFENTIGYLDPILGPSEHDFERILLRRHAPDDDPVPAVDRAIEQLELKVQRAREMEARLEDFILDRRSFRKDQADEILNREPRFTGHDLRNFVERLVRHHGGGVRPTGPGTVELRTPPKLHRGNADRLRDTYLATFDPKVALEQDRLDFIAFGHELLDAALRLATSPRFEGRAAHLVLEAPDVAPGAVFCCVFEERLSGVEPRRQLRFVVTDPDGTERADLTAVVPALLMSANGWTQTEVESAYLSGLVQRCHDAAEDMAYEALTVLERKQETGNRARFERESQKQERFYTVKLASEQRNIDRLEALYQAQLASETANDRRVAPLTLGRLDGARRRQTALREERTAARERLEETQTVSASLILLGAAWIRIERVPHGEVA